jgi:hypothetical protein
MKTLGEWKCGKCGWGAMRVSRASAEQELNDMNKYLSEVEPNRKPSSIEKYLRCFHCGAPTACFVPAGPGDIPRGATIQPRVVDIDDA